MSDLLLSEGATNKAKEADHFAFLISDVVIPDGTPRLDVVASLADAGIYTTEDDLVYGMDESDSRNERMLIKTVGHLGDSNHRWNEQALTQLAAAWPCSRTTQIELRHSCEERHVPVTNAFSDGVWTFVNRNARTAMKERRCHVSRSSTARAHVRAVAVVLCRCLRRDRG